MGRKKPPPTSNKRGRRWKVDTLKGAAKVQFAAKTTAAKKQLNSKSNPAEVWRRSERCPGAVADQLQCEALQLSQRSWGGVGGAVARFRSSQLKSAVVQHLPGEREAILASDTEPILNDFKDAQHDTSRDTSRRMHTWPDGCQLYKDISEQVDEIAKGLGCSTVASAPLSSVGQAKSGTACQSCPPWLGHSSPLWPHRREGSCVGALRRGQAQGRPLCTLWQADSTQQRAWQVIHADFCGEKIEQWRESHSKSSWPWTVLVALDDFARIRMLIGGEDLLIILRAGEAVVFRGDVLHGGAAYSIGNIRAHFYLEPVGCQLRMRNRPGDELLSLHEPRAPQGAPRCRSLPPLYESVDALVAYLCR